MSSDTTYRVGAWLVDTHRNAVGQLMAEDRREGALFLLHLRPPGGGREWSTKPESVRLATDQDLKERGLVRRHMRSWLNGPTAVEQVIPRRTP